MDVNEVKNLIFSVGVYIESAHPLTTDHNIVLRLNELVGL